MARGRPWRQAGAAQADRRVAPGRRRRGLLVQKYLLTRTKVPILTREEVQAAWRERGEGVCSRIYGLSLSLAFSLSLSLSLSHAFRESAPAFKVSFPIYRPSICPINQ
jgi:hypothetical protein